jgi:hypothetical protein
VIEPATDELVTPLYPVRGYNSLTMLREIARRIARDERPAFIYQLGDLDPSGDHATEEAQDEIFDFVRDDFGSMIELNFERLAINYHQVDTLMVGEGFQPISAFARETNRKDPRLTGYERKYGDGFPSFELDIIQPLMLRQMVRDAIERHISVGEVEEAARLAAEQADAIRVALGIWKSGRRFSQI